MICAAVEARGESKAGRVGASEHRQQERGCDHVATQGSGVFFERGMIFMLELRMTHAGPLSGGSVPAIVRRTGPRSPPPVHKDKLAGGL